MICNDANNDDKQEEKADANYFKFGFSNDYNFI